MDALRESERGKASPLLSKAVPGGPPPKSLFDRPELDEQLMQHLEAVGRRVSYG